tara:strand:+ start:3569 stop:3685 length:117 start_codon:yes stop_codon:yes gene_type:complete
MAEFERESKSYVKATFLGANASNKTDGKKVDFRGNRNK